MPVARLRTHPSRPRATDVAEADYVPHLSLDDWRETPAADEQPSTTATERMWWRHNGRLAYAEGARVPDFALPDLVGDAEHQAALRGEPMVPAKRGRRS